MNNLYDLWSEALLTHQNITSDTPHVISAEKLSPVGEYIFNPTDCIFRNFLGADYDKSIIMDMLPDSSDALINYINRGFDDYVSNVHPYSWQDRIEDYLFKCNKFKSSIRLNRKKAIDVVNSGWLCKILEIKCISLVINKNLPSVIFEFEYAIDEYLMEYGFCFIVQNETIEFVIRDVCMDIRMANGDKYEDEFL